MPPAVCDIGCPCRRPIGPADHPDTTVGSTARPAATLLPKGMIAVVLACADLLMLYAVVLAAVGIRKWASHWLPIEIGPHVYAGVILATPFVPLAYALAQLYPGYGTTGVERLRKRVTVTALCFGAMILFDHLAQGGQWSRGILVAAAALSIIVMPLWDGLIRHVLVRLRWWGEPAIILGPAKRRKGLIDTLNRHPHLGWIPAAEAELFRADNMPQGKYALALVLVPDDGAALSALTDHLPFQRVVIIPGGGSVQSLWVSVRDLGAQLGLEMRRNLLVRHNQIVKRSLDLILGGLALVAAGPVILLAGALTTLLSPGPMFYAQLRHGLDSQPFRMWKLRTMLPGADNMLDAVIGGSEEARQEWQRSMKVRNDPRIIPGIGHILREFSIDELPQLWNVLRGDMSLVGPRPLPSYHVERLDPATDRIRRRVRPGITGLWQVSGRSDTSLDEQQHLDAYYVRNWSLWLDIHILARTVLVVCSGRGAW